MMARFPRKLIGTVVLLVIVVNIWFLSQKHLPKNLDIPLATQPTPQEAGKPDFGQHQDEPWTKDPNEQPSKGNNAHPATDKDPVLDNKGGSAKGSHKGDSTSKDGKYLSETSIETAKEPQIPSQSTVSGYAPQYDAGMNAIKAVLDAIAEIKPGTKPLQKYDRDIKSDTPLEEGGDLPSTSTILSMYLQVSDEETNTLKRSHQKMFSKLPNSLPENSFSGRGIVMTGGGTYFPMVLTAIRWLRESDKETPIEVFMADKSEYEPHICEKLFPELNVECRVIRDIYGAQLSNKLSSKYALKPLAILASKFNDVYFMDADSYPLGSVSKVFDWDVYKETGLILNADYWPRYISPHFFDIAGIKLGGRARGDPNSGVLLQSDRENAIPGRSTESGQVFVRKTAHIKSLLLAMYYNLFGPDHYFPLLMQGGHGEGDKDTYAAAAVICGESYYQTQRRPVTLGQHREDGSYKGFAMSQPNPITDYEIFEHHRDDVKEEFFALHANSIKSNPKYLLASYEEPMRGAPPLRQQRFFGDMSNIRRELLKDDDVEHKLFKVMSDVACDWAVEKKFIPKDWMDSDPERFCRILKKHTQWLSENREVDAPVDAPFWIDLDTKH